MRPLAEFPLAPRNRIRGVLFDIDDTLTTDGRLTAAAYAAMENLHGARLLVIPITGRPAGWCDHIARMWPVDAVVGENGAFYFTFAQGRLEKRFQEDAAARAAKRELFAERFGQDLDAANREVVFVGDSPNDAPMFGFFENSVGVANVRRFAARLAAAPKFVTQAEAGGGLPGPALSPLPGKSAPPARSPRPHP